MRVNQRVATPSRDRAIPRPRRAAHQVARNQEDYQRDFWTHFDLEKFARDWRRLAMKRD